VNVSCSHNSGDFFPCGATKVTCIATDDEGMVDSCYFFVFVNCLCAYFTNLTLECDTLPDTYRFSADLINQTNSGMTCQPPIITASIPSQYSVSVNNMIQNSNGDYHIEGTFFTQFCPNPTGFGLNASLTCICADGLPVTCNTSAYFPAICCDSVYIAPQAVCASKDTGIVALSYWNTICNVSKINWYLQDAPCPPIPFGGIPFQSSLGYQDLQFNPSLLSGSDLCIYAELILDNDDKPCDTLLSEMAVITMCDDVSCSMSPDQVYCQTDGSPGVLPMPITLTAIIPECDYTIEWYDYLGNLIPGMTGMYTYQPPILSLPAGTTCGHDFTYTVVITGPCGPISCSSTIRLDNDNSPDGILSISNPSVPIGDSICLGDRLQVTYQPQCIDPSAVWSWETRGLDPLTPWAPLPGGSTIQTTYNSNQINTSTAYRIIKHNGVCPGDTIVANAIIRTPKEYFCSAEPLDSCRMTGIRLQAGLTPCNPGPSCSCDYTVNWYKDNVLIYSANETTSPSQFNYINATLNGNYGGIYTVEIIDNCCGGQVFTKSKEILPPPLLKISAPCYVCDPSTVSAFTGRVLNPPNGITPIYSWSEITPSGPVPISPGGSSRQLIVIGGGTWRLTATYPGGCVLSKDVTVHDCSNALSAARVIGNYGSLAFSQQYGLVLRAPGGAFFKMIWRPGGPLMTTPYSYTSGQSNTIVIEDADLLINQSNQGFLLKDHAGNEMPKIKLEQAQLVSTLNYTMVDGIEAIDSDLVFIDNNYGIVLRDEDGSIYRIKVDNAGEISVEKILD
jgi:hypothetical protein